MVPSLHSHPCSVILQPLCQETGSISPLLKPALAIYFTCSGQWDISKYKTSRAWKSFSLVLKTLRKPCAYAPAGLLKDERPHGREPRCSTNCKTYEWNHLQPAGPKRQQNSRTTEPLASSRCMRQISRAKQDQIDKTPSRPTKL